MLKLAFYLPSIASRHCLAASTGSSALAIPPPTITKSGSSATISLIVSGLIPPATATLEFLMTDLTVRKLSNGDCPSACKS